MNNRLQQRHEYSRGPWPASVQHSKQHASALLRSLTARLRTIRRRQLRRARLQSQQPLKVQRAKQLVHVGVVTRVRAFAVVARERRSVRMREQPQHGARKSSLRQRAPRRRLGCALAGIGAAQLPVHWSAGRRETGAHLQRAERSDLARLARCSACETRRCSAVPRRHLQYAIGPLQSALRAHPEQRAADQRRLLRRVRRPQVAAGACVPSAQKNGPLRTTPGVASRAPRRRCEAASLLVESRPLPPAVTRCEAPGRGAQRREGAVLRRMATRLFQVVFCLPLSHDTAARLTPSAASRAPAKPRRARSRPCLRALSTGARRGDARCPRKRAHTMRATSRQPNAEPMRRGRSGWAL